MLCLTRKVNESIVIEIQHCGKPTTIEIMVVDIRRSSEGPKARIGIRAPRDIPILRSEIRERKNLDLET